MSDDKRQVQFHITKEKFDALTWDDLITIQAASEGEFKPREWKELALRFIVDENKHPLDAATARRVLGKLTNEQMGAALTKLANAITGYAVPKATGNAS